MKKALIRYVMDLHGEHMTLGQLRRQASNKRETANSLTKQVPMQPVGLATRDMSRDPFQQEQREIALYRKRMQADSPFPNNAAKGLDAAKAIEGAAWRSFRGHQDANRYPEDRVYPDIGPMTLLRMVESAHPNLVWQALCMTMKILVTCDREVQALMSAFRQVPIFQGLSDAEIAEGMLPIPPGLLQGVSLKNAFIPLSILAILLEKSGSPISPDSMLMESLAGPRIGRQIMQDLKSTFGDIPMPFVDSLPPEVMESGVSTD